MNLPFDKESVLKYLWQLSDDDLEDLLGELLGEEPSDDEPSEDDEVTDDELLSPDDVTQSPTQQW